MTTTTKEPAPAAGGSGLSPRRRQRISRSVQYVLFIAVVALAALAADWGRIQEYFLDPSATGDMFPSLFTVALKNTIIYTLSAYVVGFAIGLLVALMRLSSVAPYRWFGLIFIEIFRGLPALLILVL